MIHTNRMIEIEENARKLAYLANCGHIPIEDGRVMMVASEDIDYLLRKIRHLKNEAAQENWEATNMTFNARLT
jgi:hypothetical protein